MEHPILDPILGVYIKRRKLQANFSDFCIGGGKWASPRLRPVRPPAAGLFNSLLEDRALTYSAGRYTVHFNRVPAVIAPLAKELSTIEATADRTRAEPLLAKYDTLPTDLTAALKVTKEYPGRHRPGLLVPTVA
jgi:hypothetical protein